MKKIKFIVCFLIFCAGCTSQAHRNRDILKDKLNHGVKILDESYYDGKSRIALCRTDELCIYYYFIPDEEDYEIVNIAYKNDSIASGIILNIKYPERDITIINSLDEFIEDKEVLNALEESFYRAIKAWDMEWDELDEFMVWYKLNLVKGTLIPYKKL